MALTLTTPQDAEDLLWGLLLFGAGGGGRPELGRRYLMDHLEQGRAIRLPDPASLPDDAWVCSVAGVGSIAPAPSLSAEERQRLGYGAVVAERPMVEAVRALEEVAGVRVIALVAAELGAGNTPGPIDAAMRLGIEVVDGDYAGRAVPEMTQVLPAIHGASLLPATYCDPWGNVLVLKATPSARVEERIGKAISGVTKLPDPAAVCARAAFLMRAAEMKRLVIPGTVSRSFAVGRAVREALARGADAGQATAEAVGGRTLFRGVVQTKDWESREGYMIGTTILEGVGDDAERRGKIWFKNEHHLLWVDDQVMATSPDTLAVLDEATGRPFTNTELPQGQRVAVLGIPADRRYRSAEALAVLSPRAFGFDIPYTPLSGTGTGAEGPR